MFQWNPGIYMDDKVKEKPGYYRRLVERKKMFKSCYCITLPANPENCMDIYSSREFWFRYYRKRKVEIIGLAADENGVEQILARMAQDIMNSFGEMNAERVRAYFEQKL